MEFQRISTLFVGSSDCLKQSVARLRHAYNRRRRHLAETRRTLNKRQTRLSLRTKEKVKQCDQLKSDNVSAVQIYYSNSLFCQREGCALARAPQHSIVTAKRNSIRVAPFKNVGDLVWSERTKERRFECRRCRQQFRPLRSEIFRA